MEEQNWKTWDEALQYAFRELDKKGWNTKNNGRYYFVVNEGKEYPNKKVLEFVEKYFRKNKLELIVPSSANNGERLNIFLENNGAKIISKKDSFISSCIREQSNVIKKLLEEYKKKISSGALKDEEYKWLLFATQKGMPSLQKNTIVNELLSMKFVNLLYYSAISTMKHLNNERKEQYSDLLLALYDENIDLEERIKQFSGDIESLYREVETKLQHHHDERTISTLLSFKYPEKYLLFKNSFYKKLCDILKIESLEKGEKYLDYLEIAGEIRDNFIKKDTELLSLIKQYLPEGSFDDSNYNLLTQDFLYTMLEKSNDYYDKFKKVKEFFNDKLKELKDSSIKYNGINGKDFQWVQDEYGIIGNDYIHYELYCDKSSIYIDLHLEDEKQSEEITLLLKKLYGHLLNKTYDSELVYWIDWAKKNNSKDYFQSIRFYKAFSLDEEDILEEQSISEMIQSFIDLDKIIGDDIREFLINNNQVENQLAEIYKAGKEMNIPLNQILYGPPGTGKTYHTIAKALAIVAPDFDLGKEREVVKQEFNKYVENGQIVFTTFHQSMTYEDFVEGIKPEIEDNIETGQRTVVYDINDGIFKSIVKDAKLIHQVSDINVDWNNINYYKMSLGGKQNPLEHDYCIMNNVGGISWGGEHDLSELTSLVKWEEYRDRFKELYPDLVSESSYNVLATFTLNKMKEGDIVIATKGNHIIDAIGIVKGGYTYDNNNETSLRHFRSIEWIIKDLNANPEKFFDKKISQQSIYEFYNANVKKDVFKNLLNVKNDNTPLSYVLIIDEINRGNVSAIFGELITLIEESKRLGKEEELQVTLPYSKDKFGVPANLYLIGTMNTADRSVEALDTALRRRFTFEEMMPNYEVIKSENSLGIDLREVLETINARIEVLLDRDHLIGHSYFLGVDSIDILMARFKNNILPLLQEYFYGDYGKIGLVLGEGFVTKIEEMKVRFASFDYDSDMFQNKVTYVLKSIDNEEEFRIAIDTLLIKN